MKFSIAATFLLSSLGYVASQQEGTFEQEGNPTITLKECTIAGGCTSRQAKLTLDANWRWIHSTSGSQNCYTGDTWDSQLCSDPVQCAQNCALEGVSQNKYRDTYGIHQVQDGVKMKFVTDHQHGTNVGGRLYVMDTDENYKLFFLKNREFSFEVDVSELMCGMNGAMYFSEMEANGGKGQGNNNAGAKFGTGYCDAQCPHDIKFISGEANVIDWTQNSNDQSGNMGSGKYGSCCAEMDIWEANSMATAYTPHTCSIEKLFRCEDTDCGDNDSGERYDGVCDKDGCDINPYRMGDTSFYGRGSQYQVDTTKPMTVVTQFLTTDGTDSGDLSEIKRFYVQDGKTIHSPSSTILGPNDSDSITDAFCDAKKDLFDDVKDFQEHGGMKGMGESLDRGHVMVFSLWDDVDVNMLWLDSAFPLGEPVTKPGIKRGDCPGGEESTPTYLRDKYPDSYVTFKNAAVGEIGSTVDPVTPTAPSPNPPTANPPTANPPTGNPPTSCGSNGCCSLNFKDCDASWCGSTQSECLSCDQEVGWVCPGQDCLPRWSGCNGNEDGCCDGLTCIFVNPGYSQCQYVENTPTKAPVTPSTKSPTRNPTTPDTPTKSPTTPEGCFSNNHKDCIPDGYPSEGESCNKIWLPNGAQSNCLALWGECTGQENDCCGPATCHGDSNYATCVPDETISPPPTTSPPTTSPPTSSPPTPQPCIVCNDIKTNKMSQDGKDCADSSTTLNKKCNNSSNWIKKKYCQLSCYNSGNGYPGDVCCNDNEPTEAPTSASDPQPIISCSDGAGQSTWNALLVMDSITYKVSDSPYVLSVVSSGGAAGDGSYVVSESQAYGLLTAGLTILSMEENDPNYNDAKLRFEGYFNGWRQMCRNSVSPQACQEPSYCDGGNTPCLPGWKHLADFSAVAGTGAAPDGDEDAIIGIIIALKAVETDLIKPSWYEEVHEWADRSCTQFLQDNTVLSSSGSHRLLKLGSCWGGWDTEGNNPSYHAPGHYRMMRDFQASIKNRSYSLPSFATSDSWNKLIDTSYKFLETTQCPDTGLVPNWALVKEVNSQTLAKKNGSFSGSGTPQHEFGAEASRTMWRVAFDAAAYPEESASQSGAFLAPLHTKLVENFDPNPLNGWEYFGENSLQACNPIVSHVFGSWQWNYFISAPVFSSLVGEISIDNFTEKTFDQQTMVNAACERVIDTANQSYYPLSWQVIAQMTLNGEVAKAGALFHESSS